MPPRFLPRLVEADLSHNKILTVEDRTFVMQRALRKLSLESNRIGRVSNRSFEGLRSLRELSLRSNQLEALPENLFKFAANLEELDLSRNRIGEVHQSAFKGTFVYFGAENMEEIRFVQLNCHKSMAPMANLANSFNKISIKIPNKFTYKSTIEITIEITNKIANKITDRFAVIGLGANTHNLDPLDALAPVTGHRDGPLRARLEQARKFARVEMFRSGARAITA